MDTIFAWFFRIYLGLLVAGVIGLIVIAPGVYIVKDIKERALDLRASKLEECLTIAWSWCSGALFSLTIGSFIAMWIYGPIASTNVWFLCLCYVVVMVPWVIVGLVGRWIVRLIAPPSDAYAERRMAERRLKTQGTLPMSRRKPE